VGAAILELTTLWDNPIRSLEGIVLILLGLPFYFYWSRKSRADVAGAAESLTTRSST
jgi:hypothetical protein